MNMHRARRVGGHGDDAGGMTIAEHKVSTSDGDEIELPRRSRLAGTAELAC